MEYEKKIILYFIICKDMIVKIQFSAIIIVYLFGK